MGGNGWEGLAGVTGAFAQIEDEDVVGMCIAILVPLILICASCSPSRSSLSVLMLCRRAFLKPQLRFFDQILR